MLLDLPPLRLAGGSPVNKGRAWQSNEWNQTAQNCSLISFIQVDPLKLGPNEEHARQNGGFPNNLLIFSCQGTFNNSNSRASTVCDKVAVVLPPGGQLMLVKPMKTIKDNKDAKVMTSTYICKILQVSNKKWILLQTKTCGRLVGF
jgi:hypothetical protein